MKDDPKLKEYREKYQAFLTEILTLAKHDAPDATAKEIFALETRLARAHWTNVESRDAVKTYNKRTLADLPKEFPGFDWAGLDFRARHRARRPPSSSLSPVT